MKLTQKLNFRKNESFLYITFFKKIRINLLIIPVFYSAYKFNFLDLLTLSYMTAFIHECFHVAAMTLFKIPLKRIDIQPFGICAYLNNVSVFSSYKEALIALSGPLFNFSAAFILMAINKYTSHDLLAFAIHINLLMGAFNLIPTLPLDGGRTLRALLSMRFGIIKAYNFMLSLSRKIIFLILTIGVIIILFIPFNFSLILICTFLLSNITNEEKSLNHIILRDILSTKERADTNKPLDTKVITVSEDAPARCILKFLSFDYCLEILLLDKAGKIVRCASETEVVELLLNNGIRSKFSELY